jgi:PBSX family phage terminase large subunit|nr:MAG TPA: terminase large subunit [Caudoviricetes sp.]
MNLTPKQKAFADWYIKNGGNASDAARKAGYKNYEVEGYRLIRNDKVLSYIAEKQAKIEKQKCTDIMSLAEIQQRRSMIARGELTDSFGFAPDFSDQLKSMNDLEKTLAIKEAREEQQKAEEKARLQGEYHIDLNIVPDVFHKMIRDIRAKKHSEYILPGGRGSMKSSTISLIIPELLKNNPNMHALILRKVGNTIKDSVYAQMKWAIDKLDLNEEFVCKVSPMEITYKPTGQKIYFRGADDPLKIKSIKPEFGYIGIVWFEELDQFAGPEEIRNIQQSAIRGGNEAYKFKSFNPPRSKNNWANEYTTEAEEKDDSALVVHSTYLDLDIEQEWLGDIFLADAEHLKEVNPDAYENEYLGHANGNGGNIFEYIEERTITDEEISHFDRIYQGVDWGWFPDPYAFARLYYDHARETIYFLDEIGENKKSNDWTAAEIKKRGYDDYVITCDSAENKSVNDYRDAGLPARGAIKGPGSVEYSMKWLQKRKLVFDPARTPKALKEFKKYEYERDKDGNIISGYPDKDNHFIDACRYATEEMWRRRGYSA